MCVCLCVCFAETSNNKKLMDEYEKFEELQAKGQRMQEVSYYNTKSNAVCECMKSLLWSLQTGNDVSSCV